MIEKFLAIEQEEFKTSLVFVNFLHMQGCISTVRSFPFKKVPWEVECWIIKSTKNYTKTFTFRLSLLVKQTFKNP